MCTVIETTVYAGKVEGILTGDGQEACQSINLTQKEFARLLNVSVDSVQDWEQGRRSPRGAAKTLLQVAKHHPEVLERIAS